MKKILGYIVLFTLLAGSICGIVYGIKYVNIKQDLDNSSNVELLEDYKQQIKNLTLTCEELNGQLKIVVESDKQKAEQIETLNASIIEKDTKIETLIAEKEDLQNSVTEKQAQIAELNEKVSSLETDKENNLQQIEALQTEKATLEEDIVELNNVISEKEAQITSLTSEKNDLITERDDLSLQLAESQENVANLTAQVATLQAEIERLNGLIANYESILSDVSQVNFYIENNLTYTLAIQNGTTITDAPVPADTNEYRFDGWSFDRSTVVNVGEKVISAPTTFYAVLTPKNEIRFKVGQEIETKYVAEDCTVDVFEAPTKTDYQFDCWLDEEGNVVDTATTYATKDMTLTAKYIFVMDEERIKEAVLNKAKSDGIASKSSDTVDLKYLSFTENVLFATCYKGTSTVDKYLVRIDLNNTTAEEFITNDTLVTLISEGVLKDGTLMTSQFADSQFTTAVERYINEHPTRGTAYIFDIALGQTDDGYSTDPTIVTITEDGFVVEDAPYTCAVSAQNSSSTIVMLGLSILSNYGYYDQQGIYSLMPNTVEKTVYSDGLTWIKAEVEISVSSVFGENDAATIAYVSEQIAANNMTSEDMYNTYGWSVGDKHDIALTNGEVIQVQIIGVNHDDKSDGTGKAGLTLQMVDCLSTLYAMNSKDKNAGGYAASVMKTSTLPILKALLPQEWQNVIKFVDKKSANGGSSNYSETLTLSEDLFLLSVIEVFGKSSFVQDCVNEGSIYEYWDGKTSSDRIKCYDNDGDGTPETEINWWLRSCPSSATDKFRYMGSTDGNYYSSYLRGVSFAFCI